MKVQFWQVSGYEATGEINEAAEPGTRLHAGISTATGEDVWVFYDEPLERWQQVDPTMLTDEFPTVEHPGR